MEIPTYVGKSKKKAFLPIKDKIGKRLSGWMDKLVSWVGREVLIKVVAQTIPTYAMSVFKLPKDFCYSLQSIINRFWWSNDPKKRKIHWVGSSRLCDHKADGGLGFRDLEAFDDVMLAKQLRRLINDSSSLVYRLPKARYFLSGDLFSAELGSKPSFTWRSLWGAREVICKGSWWLVGNGDNINVWDSRWIPCLWSF